MPSFSHMINSSVIFSLENRYFKYDVIVCYLKMRAWHTFGQLIEKWYHNFLKFCRFNYIQYLFQLIKKHHFLGRVHFRPIPEFRIWIMLQKTPWYIILARYFDYFYGIGSILTSEGWWLLAPLDLDLFLKIVRRSRQVVGGTLIKI